MADGHEPIALAMVPCDAVHRDPGTGKCTILGTFSVIFGRTYPVSHHAMAIYICLTECHGKVPLTLRIIDVDEERESVFRGDGEIESSDPICVLELAFSIGGMVFPAPGEYRVQLFSAGHLLIERRLIAISAVNPNQHSP